MLRNKLNIHTHKQKFTLLVVNEHTHTHTHAPHTYTHRRPNWIGIYSLVENQNNSVKKSPYTNSKKLGLRIIAAQNGIH